MCIFLHNQRHEYPITQGLRFSSKSFDYCLLGWDFVDGYRGTITSIITSCEMLVITYKTIMTCTFKFDCLCDVCHVTVFVYFVTVI